LEICLKLKIPAVTVYAFSIDNFKRTQEEVDALMGLAKVKLSELAGHGYVSLFGRWADGRDLLQQYGVKIRFIGRRDMLPQDVLEAVDRMEGMTSGNKKWVIHRGEVLMRSGVLNVCSPYTARDETTTAIRSSVQEVYDGSLPLRYVPSCPVSLSYLFLESPCTARMLTNRNLTHSHIYNNLETNQSIRSITPLAKGLEKECGKIDIYVRTSDVRRLSDFQMWQVSLNSMGRRPDDVGSG
jgi:ditrans,polycis-polyprenyl diphosphate synthase